MQKESSQSIRLRRVVCNIILITVYVILIVAWSIQDSLGLFAFVLVVTLGMLAFVSWLYNEELGRSYEQTRRSERILREQKRELEKEVEKRTHALKVAQIDEMRQLYRFTELGQFGVMLLHDLANQLTSLSLEVEDLQRKQQTKDIERIRHIIRYLEELMDSTRDRLHDGAQAQNFDIIQRTTEVVSFLRYKATKAGVTIEWNPPPHLWKCYGDPMCWGQVVTILTNNAIDAYSEAPHKTPRLKDRRVVVDMEQTEHDIVLSVKDWAGGIPKMKQKMLFKPFQSTKKTGLGLGLFIAKQTVELNFNGSVSVHSHGKLVEFIITIPRT